MDIVIFGIWLVTYLVGAVWYILYLMHMFQQNSYKPREYGEWMGYMPTWEDCWASACMR